MHLSFSSNNKAMSLCFFRNFLLKNISPYCFRAISFILYCMEAETKSIPNRLRMHRRLHGLKQNHVAMLLGFHTTTQLSQWESGQTMPNSANLIKLGIIYNTFPNELYFEYYQALKDEIKSAQYSIGQ